MALILCITPLVLWLFRIIKDNNFYKKLLFIHQI
jgi:hypothetical protein